SERAAALEGHRSRGHPRGPPLLQERVQRKPGLVLHLLSDRAIPPACADSAVLSLHFPGGHRCWHACRRGGGGPGRAHPPHVGLDPGRPSPRAFASPPPPVLDPPPRRAHPAHHCPRPPRPPPSPPPAPP